jgi:2,3-bisphosphoglycerate-dependent phosphoglycerate mutase
VTLTTLYLVRHAHAAWTPDENRPLSAQGARDALRLAELLSAPVRAPAADTIVGVYASTARRAQQTVTPLAARQGLPLHVSPALDERRLAGGPVEDFHAAVRATWADFGFAHPGGESNAAAQARGLALVRDLCEVHPGAQIVLGTHGNLLALIVHGLLPACGYAFWRSLTMPDVYRLDLPATADKSAQTPRLTRLWTARPSRTSSERTRT